jgi:predicted deacetylase
MLWAMCRDHGVTPALLVVPNWHGEWPLDQSPAFVRWVRESAAAGADVLLHGERHDETGMRRGWRDAARAWGKTAREGEFLTLDECAARERIDRGLALFARLGLSAAGFVPPAWLAREGCIRAVAAAGLRYSEDDSAIHIHEPQGMRRIPSPVVRWSGRSPARAYASAAVAAARWRVQRSARHVRLAFHPADLDHPATARSAAQALGRWLGERPASRYTDL